MRMQCPHCGKENKMTVRLLFRQKCDFCVKRVDKNLSKKYYNIKWIGRFLALTPEFYGLEKLLSIHGILIHVITFSLYMCVEVIFMKFAYRLNQTK